MRRRLLAGLAVCLASSAPALAAEPEAGTVSAASPSVAWSGVSSAGFVTTFSQIFINALGAKPPCQAPSCDTFTLDVKDSADLDIEVASEVSITYLQVEKPDGTIVYNNGIEAEGAEDDPVTRVRIKRAPVGTYLVQTAVNSVQPGEAYSGKAVLAVAPPAPPAEPPRSEPAPPPSAAPAPAGISVKAGKLSARKLARRGRLPLTLTSSGPVTAVKVVLGAKGRAIATGRLTRLDGTRRFQLRLRSKLRPGRYDIVVEGRDANGRTVGVKATLKVSR